MIPVLIIAPDTYCKVLYLNYPSKSPTIRILSTFEDFTSAYRGYETCCRAVLLPRVEMANMVP